MSTEEHLIQIRKIIVACLSVHGYLNPKQSKRNIIQPLETEWQRSDIPFIPIKFRNGEQEATNKETNNYLCHNHIVTTILSCSCIEDEHRLEMYELLETLSYPMGIIISFGGRRLLAERIFSPTHVAQKSNKQTSYGEFL